MQNTEIVQMETLQRSYSVCAVVLTYNRKDLLDKCLFSLRHQTFMLNQIIVIDNCSDDGTDTVVNKYAVICKKLDKNYGASYGFNVALREGYNSGADYIWVMDDDTIPNKDSLAALVSAIEKQKGKNVGFFCSNIRWKDGSSCKMNTPKVSLFWNEDTINNIINLESCSFVSVLFPKDVIKKVGLPIAQFYIWQTDIEYTSRITLHYKYSGNFVINSKVIHAMKNNGIENIVVNEDPKRLERYKYAIRNQTYIARRDKQLIKYFYSVFTQIFQLIMQRRRYRMKKISMLIISTIKGLFFNPKIEYVEG